MTTSEEPSYILRHNKTATESERLDQQHHFISSFTPGFVSPAIPRAKLVNIADIATGTGIWLRELSSTLSHDQPNDRAAPSYTGFDISSSFFPTDLGPDFKFVQHDILQPFPKEYHGNYDLVHLRLLVGAVLEKQLPIALRNVIELLVPGGYLQWDEWHFIKMRFDPDRPEIRKIHTSIHALGRKVGFCQNIPDFLTELFNKDEMGFTEFKREMYWSLETMTSDAGRDDQKTRDLTRVWWLESVRALVPVLEGKNPNRSVRSPEEVEEILKREESYVKDWYAEGGILSVPLVSILGRKAL